MPLTARKSSATATGRQPDFPGAASTDPTRGRLEPEPPIIGPHQSRDDGAALLRFVLFSLDEDKAEDVVAIDLAGKTTIADHMVIASGRSSRHVTTIAEHLVERIKRSRSATCRVEGLPHADWVLVDAGDVIVHVFRPEVRDFYKLEKMWSAHLADDAAAV